MISEHELNPDGATSGVRRYTGPRLHGPDDLGGAYVVSALVLRCVTARGARPAVMTGNFGRSAVNGRPRECAAGAESSNVSHQGVVMAIHLIHQRVSNISNPCGR